MAKVKKETNEDSDDAAAAMNASELKPGQKFPTPTPGFGDRVFYETLLRQRPDSLMAQEWCINYGVLPHEEASTLFDELTKRKKRGGGSIAGSSSSPNRNKVKKSSSSSNKPSKDEPDNVGSI